MAVTADSFSTGDGSSSNNYIGTDSGATTSATLTTWATLTVNSGDTTALIFVSWESLTNFSTAGTVKLGSQTATFVANSFQTDSSSANNPVSTSIWEVKNPTVGTNTNIQISTTSGIAVTAYVMGMTCKGSDPVNPSVCWGSSSGTTEVATASTGNSPSSIPTTDLLVLWCASANSVPSGDASSNYPSTGVGAFTFIDNDTSLNANMSTAYWVGAGSVADLKATLSAADWWAAIGVHIAIPAVPKGGNLPMMGVG